MERHRQHGVPESVGKFVGLTGVAVIHDGGGGRESRVGGSAPKPGSDRVCA
jgi:hypothetical protein